MPSATSGASPCPPSRRPRNTRTPRAPTAGPPSRKYRRRNSGRSPRSTVEGGADARLLRWSLRPAHFVPAPASAPREFPCRAAERLVPILGTLDRNSSGAACREGQVVRSQRGRWTSSTCWKTTRTGSPISIVAGSISLIGAVGARRQVADEADRRVLVERDDDHVVRRELRVGGQQRRDAAPTNDQTVPRPARRLPRHVDRAAARAHRPRRHAPRAARRRTPARAARRARCPPRTAPTVVVVEVGAAATPVSISVASVLREEDRARSARPRRW